MSIVIRPNNFVAMVKLLDEAKAGSLGATLRLVCADTVRIRAIAGGSFLTMVGEEFVRDAAQTAARELLELKAQIMSHGATVVTR